MNTITSFFTSIVIFFTGLFGGVSDTKPAVVNPPVVMQESEVTATSSSDLEIILPTTQTGSISHVIKLYDYDNHKKAIFSNEDSTVFDIVSDVLSKEKKIDTASGYPYNMSDITVFGDYAMVNVFYGQNTITYIINTKNKNISDSFASRNVTNVDENTLVFGTDGAGFSYYKYGSPKSVKILDSSLTGNQSYVSFDGPMGSYGYKVIATTTNSITFGIFDKTARVVAPGDDTGYYKKIGEKKFLIP